MDPNALAQVQLPGSAGAMDLSLWGLFLTSDIVVKVVIVMLLLASIWCWAIIFAKWRAVRRLNSRANDFEETFWSGGSLEDLYDRISDAPHDPMASLFGAGMKEWRHAMSRSLTSTSQMRAALQQQVHAKAQQREVLDPVIVDVDGIGPADIAQIRLREPKRLGFKSQFSACLRTIDKHCSSPVTACDEQIGQLVCIAVKAGNTTTDKELPRPGIGMHKSSLFGLFDETGNGNVVCRGIID